MNRYLISDGVIDSWGCHRCHRLVSFIGIPRAALSVSSSVLLGEGWNVSSTHSKSSSVCVCAHTAWSAVLSYRKSCGRPPLVICTGRKGRDSPFPSLLLQIVSVFIFSCWDDLLNFHLPLELLFTLFVAFSCLVSFLSACFSPLFIRYYILGKKIELFCVFSMFL